MRPARGVANRVVRELGPLSDATPEFPWAGGALAPLAAEDAAAFGGGFWAGQAVAMAPPPGDAESVAAWIAAGAARVLRETTIRP